MEQPEEIEESEEEERENKEKVRNEKGKRKSSSADTIAKAVEGEQNITDL